MPEPDLVNDRLEEQIAYYDRESATNKRWYKRLKLAVVVAAALVPMAAGFAWRVGCNETLSDLT